VPPRTPRRPTDAEFGILNILWQRGASTLREIHNIVKDRRKIGLTTTLKTLQIMTDKGLVDRDRSSRPGYYTAALEMAELPENSAVVQSLLRNLSRRAP